MPSRPVETDVVELKPEDVQHVTGGCHLPPPPCPPPGWPPPPDPGPVYFQ